MLKLYIGKLHPSYSYIPLLFPQLGKIDRPEWLSNLHAFDSLNKPLFQLVKNPHQADYFLLPHHYSLISNQQSYIGYWQKLIYKYKKPIIVIHYGDLFNHVKLSHSIVFRTSQYKHKLKPNEIIMPAYIDDLGKKHLQLSSKHSKPTVGFCGWANYSSLTHKVRSSLTNLQSNFLNTLGLPYAKYYQSPIILRKRAIDKLIKSNIINADIITRSAYSGHKKTIKGDLINNRHEYIHNIIHNDYNLCVRGDGNYSQRFFEVLSMGRTPALIDTDVSLPLEDTIEYEKYIVRTPLNSISNIDKQIVEHHKLINSKSWIKKQIDTRKIFLKYLRIDKFFNYYLNHKRLSPYLCI